MPRFATEPAWETLVSAHFNVAAANHARTTRWTYTVPAGRYAVVDHAFARVDPTAAAGDADVLIDWRDAAGTTLGFLLLALSRPTDPTVVHYAGGLVLDAGEQLVASTVKTPAGAIAFQGSARIREVVK